MNHSATYRNFYGCKVPKLTTQPFTVGLRNTRKSWVDTLSKLSNDQDIDVFAKLSASMFLKVMRMSLWNSFVRTKYESI